MSDGPAWGDAASRPTDPRDLARLTTDAASKRAALSGAIRGNAVLWGALRVVMLLARPFAAGLPFGATVAEIVEVGMGEVERETS